LIDEAEFSNSLCGHWKSSRRFFSFDDFFKDAKAIRAVGDGFYD
jgi:hypothetical protein